MEAVKHSSRIRSSLAGLVQAHRDKYFISERASEKLPVLALLPRIARVDPKIHFT